MTSPTLGVGSFTDFRSLRSACCGVSTTLAWLLPGLGSNWSLWVIVAVLVCVPGAATTALSDGRFMATVARGWRAGRGPHGGYLAAMLLRALVETVDDPGRTPRSLTIHYTRAPEPGEVEIEVTVERAGRSLTTLSARMLQGGRTTALALAAFSVPWRSPEGG